MIFIKIYILLYVAVFFAYAITAVKGDTTNPNVSKAFNAMFWFLISGIAVGGLGALTSVLFFWK